MTAVTALPKSSHRERTIASYRQAVLRVVAHLKANLGEDHTLEDMADIAILSPFHFNRVFSEIAGVSPVRYLYALRIEEAKRLVLSTRLKVIDICYSVGYQSVGSFNKRFVALVGYSPRRIRSLAARVDPAELRRLIDIRADHGVLGCHPPCSVWGTVHAPLDFAGISMVALFPGSPSNDYPVASILSERGAYALPLVRTGGTFSAMAIGLEWHRNMVDFLLQPNCLQAVTSPIHLSAGRHNGPIDFHLAPRQLVDPPVPPSLVFRLLDQFIGVPEEPPEEEAPASHFFIGHGAAMPTRPTLAHSLVPGE